MKRSKFTTRQGLVMLSGVLGGMVFSTAQALTVLTVLIARIKE
jgi:hypothetical protein